MLNKNDATKISDGIYETESGIEIWSRYDYEEELQEMFEFCHLIAKAELDPFIKKIFYDSKASICIIETSLDDGIDITNKTSESLCIEETIETIALLTITQFQLFTKTGHQNYRLRKLFNIEKLIS